MTNSRVLLVDDEASVLKALSRVLRRAGYEVTSTTTPQDALQILAEQRFAVIIADYRMPHMNGADFLRHAHSIQPLACNLVLSGDADIDDVIQCMNDDIADRFLRKPWDNDALVAEVANAVEKYRINNMLASRHSTDGVYHHLAISVLNIHSVDFQQFWQRIRMDFWGQSMLIDMKWMLPGSDAPLSLDPTDVLCNGLSELCQQWPSKPTLVELDEQELALVIPKVDGWASARIIADQLACWLQHASERQQCLPAYIGYRWLDGTPSSFTRVLLSAESAWKSQAQPSVNHAYEFETNGIDSAEVMLQQLREATENKELSLMFQPKVSAQSGEIDGVECLLRWNNRQLGSVSPNVFIPLAEEHGCIIDIGRWVLEESVHMLARWRQVSPQQQFKLALNVSPKQLTDDSFVNLMAECLRNEHLSAANIRVEVTETAAMEDFDHCYKQLNQLCELGVEVAIDDFGTGHAAIQYLTDLPAQVVKLDRSLIHQLESNDKRRTVVKSLIAMSQSLGMKVVAEGVETQQHADFLRSIGCDELQGFYFSKPVSEHDLMQLMATQPFRYSEV